MSREEIKQEITKTLDQFSEKALEDLLSFLKQLQKPDSISLTSGDHLKNVLSEDRELLERLAR